MDPPVLGSHQSVLCSLQVFTRECMSHYLRVFNFLWRAKRMEYILTDIRKGHMCNAKLLRNLPGTCPPTASAAFLKRKSLKKLKSGFFCAVGSVCCEEARL